MAGFLPKWERGSKLDLRSGIASTLAVAPSALSDYRRCQFMINRRGFLQTMGLAMGLVSGSAGIYGCFEAHACEVSEQAIPVPRLPAEFANLRVAFLSDLHRSGLVSQTYLQGVIERTNALRADLIVLGGDYITRGNDGYIAPCFELLATLRAPLGVFGVLGNHDQLDNEKRPVKTAMKAAGIGELTNTGFWLQRGSGRVRLCGVGDFITDHQDLPAALKGCGPSDCALLVTHNPDFIETIRDPRVSLALCGHTHGGQVRIPGFGALFPHSLYGAKYVMGLCQAPATQVFVSRGVGTIGLPVRIDCPPEIVVLTLQQALA